ncbi:MAG: cysteine desulfurase family protein [bacterium]
MYYFDYAASAPPFPQALEEFARVSEAHFANPSSTHRLGSSAQQLLKQTKQKFSQLCHAPNARLILTSGGTEANNLIIRGVMEKYPNGRLLLAADVHASDWFAKELYAKRVDVVPLEKDGRWLPQKIQSAIRKKTVLFSAPHVCNEIGTIHDIAAYSEICRKNNLCFHCDGVQALGHIPVSLENVAVDFYTFSAHKFGGPRGVGGVLARSTDLMPQMLGGSQEYELRAGTENPAGLAAALKALEMSCAALTEEAERLHRLKDVFLEKLKTPASDFFINSSDDGLPGLISLSFPGTIGASLVAEMSLRGFAISAGSACHADQVRPSRIITGIGRSEREALGTVRISMGRNTTQDETLALAEMLVQVVERQRGLV